MNQHILAVGGSELQAAQKSHQPQIEVKTPNLKRRSLAGGFDLSLDVLSNFFDDLLDARGLNSAVGDQLLQSVFGDVPAYRIKGRDHNSARRVVHNDLNPRSPLERPDVAAFAADDLALDFIAGDLDGCGCYLRDGGRGNPLDDGGENLFSSPLQLIKARGFKFADALHQSLPMVLLDGFREFFNGAFFCEPGDALKLLFDSCPRFVKFGFYRLDFFNARLNVFFASFDIQQFLVQKTLAIFQSVLEPLNLLLAIFFFLFCLL